MIELHYWPTPNGHKITLLLEELVDAGQPLAYDIKPVNIGTGEQFEPAFLAIAPNNRMPAIVDTAPADGGAPISVFESGAILLYLAEKTGRFLPQDPRGRAATLEFVPNEDRVSPPGPAAFSLTMLATTASGDAYTRSELYGMYREAGYSSTEAHPVPNGPHTVVIGWK